MTLDEIVKINKLHKNKNGELFRTIRVDRIDGTQGWIKELKEFRSAWDVLIEYELTKLKKIVSFTRYGKAYAVRDYDHDEYISLFPSEKITVTRR